MTVSTNHYYDYHLILSHLIALHSIIIISLSSHLIIISYHPYLLLLPCHLIPTPLPVGAILAAGILDAGGRNVVVSMQSRAGFMKMGYVT